ncbi:MAG: hypothetical protein NVS9B7_09600 [Flavisolibacter sp.]
MDSENRMWILTRSNNLYLFQISGNGPQERLDLVHIYTFDIANSGPRSITVDRKGNIWIGTRDNGLYCFTYNKTSLFLKHHLSVKDGLTDGFIQYLYSDPSGNVWAGSPAGLDKINLDSGKFVIENITKPNNLYLNIFKIQLDKSGTVWGLSHSGLLKINPQRDSATSIKPTIALTEIIAGNHTIEDFHSTLSLPYGLNNLTFKVAALSFYDEHQNLFSYQLQGKGKNYWSVPTNISEIHFADLPPGSYVLHIKVKFPHLERQQELSQAFTIDNPWWQSLWFYLIIAILSLSIIWSFTRLYYRNKLRKQKDALERQQAVEKERTRIATDMHDDLGAGLSRIMFLSETIRSKNKKGLLEDEDLHKIVGYSHDMISKMGEIIWALNEKNDSLMDLISYSRAYSVEYLTSNHIVCDFTMPVESPELMVSGETRRNIFLSIKEILHNIVKHASATEVRISVSLLNGLVITIKDNGLGIDLENLRPFSNGLNNIKKRMQEINGSAHFINDQGTKVELFLPLKI